MKSFVSAFITVSVFCFVGCQNNANNTNFEYNSNPGTDNVISSDTDWSGNVKLTGVQRIRSVALTIDSGATVILDRDAVLIVENGGKLNIQKRSKFLFSDGSYIYIDSGTISANGTISDSVFFTKNSDEAAGGVVLNKGSKSNLSFCDFSGMNNGISAKGGASINVSDCKISRCKSHGIILEPGVLIQDSTAFARNKLTGNGGYGLEIGANNVDKISKSNIFDSNILNGVHISGEFVNHSCLWNKLQVPYNVSGTIKIFDPAKAPTLSIEPGCVFLMEKYSSFEIGSDSTSKTSDSLSGTLIAQGTNEDSIFFRPQNGSQGWGYLEYKNAPHGGLHFKKKASALSVLDYCVIDSAVTGIYLTGGTSIKLTNSHICGSYNSGIICDSSAGFVDSTCFANNSLSGNQNYGIELFPSFVSSISQTNRFENNRGVKISGGTVSKSAWWRKLDSPYYVTGEVKIADSTGPVLTIEPGTVFLMDSTSFFHVASNSQPATLIVQGTLADSIKFKPASDSLEWGYQSKPFYGLFFDEKASDTSSVQYTSINFAKGGIYMSVPVKVNNCTISKNSQYCIGISKTGLDTNFQQNTYLPNKGADTIKYFSN